MMGPRVRVPENRGGECVEGRAAFWGHAGIAWRTGGKDVVGKRSKKPGSAWRTRPRGEAIHPRAAAAGMTSDLSIGVHDEFLAPVIPTRHRHRHRPCLAAGRCCRGVADLRAPERLRSGSDHGFDRDVHGAHLLAGSRSNHQPLPSEAARSATALRDRPQADVHGVRSSAPTERCVVERAAVRTGKNS